MILQVTVMILSMNQRQILIRPHQLHIITVRTVARGGGGGLKRPSDRDIKVTLKKLCGLKTRLQMLNLLIT